MNSTAVIIRDVSIIVDIIITSITILYTLIIRDKAVKNKSIEKIIFIIKVLLKI
jgi:hypothetical protein